ncbi:MAG: LamB/YcsF family protein [Candidatus Ventricola sp.]
MPSIDLNCDLGESFGAYTLGMDSAVIPYITSANVACGYHAGDPLVMQKTVAACKANGVHIGAHPGYPDLMGFGRRNIAATQAEVKAYIQYQVGALSAFCAARALGLSVKNEVFADRGYQRDGTLVPRSKPGAMITDEDEAIARVIRMAKEGVVRSVDGVDVPLTADSVCVHGDGEKALAFVRRIRATLTEAGIEVRAL